MNIKNWIALKNQFGTPYSFVVAESILCFYISLNHYLRLLNEDDFLSDFAILLHRGTMILFMCLGIYILLSIKKQKSIWFSKEQ